MKMNMDHVHVKTKSMARSNSSKMACEKASRRLKATLHKANKLGVTTTEIAKLPSAKKLITERDHGWRLAVFMILMFVGGVVIALVCIAKNGCTRIEDISLAT
ncbi:hypothetical protein HCN44_002299 [Aphidius gifuensis]|uniref:Uncharacterized protein n=1 Tax=Aphidius gifuensis TaxID=684658 RepID=A0A834Y2U5_APHGI|nr:hypothetical protein HCN44_002299 [Aphidius gifuensis]